MIPHLVWSATTTSRRPAAMRARLASASRRLGVVKPDLGVHAVHSHENQVEMGGLKCGNGERTDESV